MQVANINIYIYIYRKLGISTGSWSGNAKIQVIKRTVSRGGLMRGSARKKKKVEHVLIVRG